MFIFLLCLCILMMAGTAEKHEARLQELEDENKQLKETSWDHEC